MRKNRLFQISIGLKFLTAVLMLVAVFQARPIPWVAAAFAAFILSQVLWHIVRRRWWRRMGELTREAERLNQKIRDRTWEFEERFEHLDRKIK